MDRLGALRLEPQGARRAVPAARQGQKPRASDHGTKGRRMKETGLAGYRPKHFQWRTEARVGVITFDRPEKKNPLTFESYGELRDLFRGLSAARDIKAVVVTGAGGNFCSGGDVHEIIGPLTKMRKPQLLKFTGMTGDLARAMSGEEGLAWGFFNALAEPGEVLKTALDAARQLASGPTFAHGMTKKMLHEEWAVGLDRAIAMEARAQAVCMQTRDFRRAYEAFVAKRKPVFEGD